MNEELITRRDLAASFNNLDKQDWQRAAERLGLIWSEKYGKGSHAVIRNPKYPDPADTKGLMATVSKKLFKSANQNIFKNLRRKGIEEDDIWRALGVLKEV